MRGREASGEAARSTRAPVIQRQLEAMSKKYSVTITGQRREKADDGKRGWWKELVEN